MKEKSEKPEFISLDYSFTPEPWPAKLPRFQAFNPVRRKKFWVTHPLFIGRSDQKQREKPILPNHQVMACFDDETGPEKTTFGTYLEHMGVQYDAYLKERGDIGKRDVFMDLHKEAVDKRMETVADIHEKRRITAEETNDRRATENAEVDRNENSPLFDMVINDAGYMEATDPGDAADDLEKIDNVIKIPDSEKPGKYRCVGIQRTLLKEGQETGADWSKTAEEKEEEIRRNPVRYIPEHPEFGPVARVFLREDRDDYYDPYSGRHYFRKSQEIWNNRRRGNPNSSPRFPSILKVLPGSPEEAAKRLVSRNLDILAKIEITLKEYIEEKKPRQDVFTPALSAVQVMAQKIKAEHAIK